MSYSIDYRKRTIAYRKEGHSYRKTSEAFRVAVETIRNWERLERENGSLEKRTLARRYKKIDPLVLHEYVSQHPHAYLHEIAQVFGCCVEAVRKACRREGIALEKAMDITKSKPCESSGI